MDTIPKVILICGSREWTDAQTISRWLTGQAYESPQYYRVIHGACRGADTIGGVIAASRGIEVKAFPADWEKHGKAAGFIRNQQMLDEGKPEVVMAFVVPGAANRGTRDMIERAIKAGVLIYVIPPGR